MGLNLKLAQKGMLVFGIMLACELLFVALLWGTLEAANREIDETNRVRTLIHHLTKLSTTIQYVSMEMFHTLIWSASSKPVSFSWSSVAYKQMPAEINQLKAWARGSEELKPIEWLQMTVDPTALMNTFNNAEQAYLIEDRPRHMMYLNSLKARSDAAIKQVNSILNYYQAKEEAAQKKEIESRNLTRWILFLGIPLNVLAVSAMVFIFVRSIITRLGVLEDNAVRVTAGFPLNPQLTGADEITVVDAAFHRMVVTLAEAKRREKAVVDNAIDVICSVNSNGTFVDVSPASLLLWGYRPQELIGKRYSELLEPGAEQPLSHIVDEQTNITFENRVVRKDGNSVDMLWSARCLPNERTWFCVAHDITDRKRAEQLKREFVAMISHDLRTPLNSVEFSLSLISAGACGDVSEKVSENVADAENNLAYVMTLIGGLLDVEKMHAGKLEMRFYPSNVGEILTRGIAAVQPLAERDSTEIITTAIDVDLIADENRLVQVLVNFLSNAMKFSPTGTKIEVVAKDLGQEVEISVTDMGPGIPIDEQERIFKRFERIQGDGKPNIEGSGLGLAICKAIIDQHGGAIGVRSDGASGSTFFFRIPKEQSKMGSVSKSRA